MTSGANDADRRDGAMRIAVIIPVHNGAPYLRPCLDSVLAQTASFHELIVVDDGSTDATPEIIRSYCARDPRVRSLRLANHGRPAAPRNRGAAASTSEWIAFLDADDVWHPDKLDRQTAMLRAQPDLVAVGGQARYLGARGPMRGVFGPPPTPDTWPEVRAGRAIPFQVASTLVVDRSTFSALGGFDEEIPVSEDFEFISRLAACGPIGFVEEEIAYYRLRRDSMVGHDYVRHMRMPHFIAARIEARSSGGDLSYDEFAATDHLTRRDRRTLHGSHRFRSIAIDLAEGRLVTAAFDAACALALTPIRTLRRLGQKVAGRRTR